MGPIVPHARIVKRLNLLRTGIQALPTIDLKMSLRLKTDFEFIPETDSNAQAFLNLFPHRWDYIYSPNGLAKPDWRTETRHPLGDRILQESVYLYGVRFGFRTRYALLDIDASSFYHPKRDPMAVDRMVETLNPLGIVSYFTITSSYSGGIHVYIPLNGEFNTWEIATTITTLLENAGFHIKPGILEVFPNRKTNPEQKYAAHRLPLQHGSYILDADWLPVGRTHEQFVSRWQFTAARNMVTQDQIDQVLKLRRFDYRISKSARKFLQDLDAEIEPGWTGHGQTNHILGRIALRGYCFGHVVEGDEVLTGDRLVRYICQTARSLPGFKDWCRHQTDLIKRAEFWARSVEASPRYFPYAVGKSLAQKESSDRESGNGNAWNILQFQLARLRIHEAVADCLNCGIGLLSGVRERLEQLTARGISADTLYRHKDLWHPDHLTDTPPEPEIKRLSLLPSIGWINKPEPGYSLSLAKNLYQQGGSLLREALLDISPGVLSSV